MHNDAQHISNLCVTFAFLKKAEHGAILVNPLL